MKFLSKHLYVPITITFVIIIIIIIIIIVAINMIICYHLIVVECQLFAVFLNHLSLVQQGSQKYLGCGRFSVLHAREIFCKVSL